jgi:flagellar hook-length control protein FliK
VNTTLGDNNSAPVAEAANESRGTNVKPTAAKGDLFPHAIARSQRGNGTAGRGARAQDATTLPNIDAGRFVGRVAKALQTAHERGGALQLRLSPPELGSLRLQLTVEGGVMSATLEAENSNARQVLLDHLPALRERLAEQNIRIERFDIDLRQEGSGGGADARSSQQERRGQQPQHPVLPRDSARSHASDDGSREAANHPRPTNGGINVLA